MPMQFQEFVFDPRPNYPLLVTAKRLWDPNSPCLNDPTAHTLIFAHATGFHKEVWEPIVDDLLAVIKSKGGDQLRIREIWLIDGPNHGDATILNEETLSWGYDLTCMYLQEHGQVQTDVENWQLDGNNTAEQFTPFLLVLGKG